jgi:hypothetical protein
MSSSGVQEESSSVEIYYLLSTFKRDRIFNKPILLTELVIKKA